MRTAKTKTDIQAIIAALDLTQPLDNTFFIQFTTAELDAIRVGLAHRAALIIGKIKAQNETDPLWIRTCENAYMNSYHNEGEFLVFNYSCDKRYEKENFFTPGAWFAPIQSEYEKTTSAQPADFEQIEKQKHDELSQILSQGKCNYF